MGCPTSSWVISTSNTGANAPAAPATLNSPTTGATKTVVPATPAIHQDYYFYLKVGANGGAYTWFGPYSLYVGCFVADGSHTSTSVTFTGYSGFSLSLNKYVGDALASVHTIVPPTASRSYCTIQSHAVVNNDATGTAWTGAAKLTVSGTSLSLVSTTIVETYYFKIKTTWTNSLTTLSNAVTVQITCSNAYTISATTITTP